MPSQDLIGEPLLEEGASYPLPGLAPIDNKTPGNIDIKPLLYPNIGDSPNQPRLDTDDEDSKDLIAPDTDGANTLKLEPHPDTLIINNTASNSLVKEPLSGLPLQDSNQANTDIDPLTGDFIAPPSASADINPQSSQKTDPLLNPGDTTPDNSTILDTQTTPLITNTNPVTDSLTSQQPTENNATITDSKATAELTQPVTLDQTDPTEIGTVISETESDKASPNITDTTGNLSLTATPPLTEKPATASDTDSTAEKAVTTPNNDGKLDTSADTDIGNVNKNTAETTPTSASKEVANPVVEADEIKVETSAQKSDTSPQIAAVSGEIVNADSNKPEEVKPTVANDSSKAEEVKPTVVTDSNKPEEVKPTVVTDSSKAEEVKPTVATDSSKAEEVNPTFATDSSKAEEIKPTVATDSSKAEEVKPTVATDSSKAEEIKLNVETAPSTSAENQTEIVTSNITEEIKPTVETAIPTFDQIETIVETASTSDQIDNNVPKQEPISQLNSNSNNSLIEKTVNSQQPDNTPTTESNSTLTQPLAPTETHTQIAVNNTANIPNTLATNNNTHSTNPSPTIAQTTNTNPTFTSGVFTVGTTGIVSIDYLFDGGLYQGELAVFSLSNMEDFTPGTPAFIAEAARRALTNSELGNIAIKDSTAGARFSGAMPGETNWNLGQYQGPTSFNMTPGDTFGIILIPNGTVKEVFDNPSISGTKRPLFSLSTANPAAGLQLGQIADVTGNGNTFAYEDLRADGWTDKDYNDIIFSVTGATGIAPPLSSSLNPSKEWRNSPIGKELIDYALTLTSDNTPPAISAELIQDTGSSNSDRLTNNPTISGKVTDSSSLASFNASFNNNSTNIELKNLLAPDGSFTLTRDLLTTINNGSELPDGTHTLELQAVDIHGNTSSFELAFTLDTTTSITLSLDPAFDSAPIGDSDTENSTVTLIGQAEPNSTIVLLGTGTVATVATANATGQFQFPGVILTPGSNSFTATATDKAGNTSTTTLTVNNNPVSESEIEWLAEGESFTKNLERTFTIPSNPSVLKVNIATINFDITDPDSINDAFEIALLDINGKSLVHTIAPGRDSFFNLTEGQPAQLAAGVTNSGSTITLDLSQIAPGTEAKVQLRLVNNDSDTATKIGIASVSIQPSSTTTPPIATPATENSVSTPVNFSHLEDVSASLEPEYKQTSFNDQTNILYTDISVRNGGQYPVRGSLLVGIDNISDPTVRVLGADGTTPEGIPYYNFTDLVSGGILKSGELTGTGTLKFYNPNEPNGVQFTYDLVFLSELNSSPEFVGEPNKEAVVGKSYAYQAIAIDPDGDAITYSLLEAPQGMAIDSASGKITWNPLNGDIGNHSVTVQVEDGKGGVDRLEYIVGAIAPPPNRPPIFTSTPVVDAAVNTLYHYDANATDPDSDSLTYNLVLGPEGMTIDPETGEVEWTPPAAMVFGDTVLGRIGSFGEQDTYTFSAVEGQQLYYDSLIGSSNQTLKLYSPSGLEVLNNYTNYQGPPLNLTETGNYRFVISGAPANYGFSLIDIDSVPIAPFDNNTTGLLSPGTEDDLYRFNGTAGQRLYFDQLSDKTNLDWVLYDGDGELVNSWGRSWGDNEVVLPNDGPYILALRGQAQFFGSVPYTFRIVTPDTITFPLSLGSNDKPNTISAAITEKGERDIYTFDGTTGQRLYFDYLSSNPQTYFEVKLVSPSGLDVFPKRSIASDTEPFTLTETGTYHLEIDGYLEGTGNYSFNLLDTGLADDIDTNTDVTGKLDPGTETHFYSFTGDAGQRLYLDSLAGTSANWTLYGAGNQRITTQTMTAFEGAHNSLGNNGGPITNDFEVALPSKGTYLLAIQGGNATPVNYKFRVITPDTQSSGALIPDAWGNVSVSGNIGEKGERDVYTFEGSANQRLLLDALVDTSKTFVRLVSPSGIEVFNTRASGDIGRNPVILPEGGTYKLIVDGDGEGTENYNFRLANLTGAPPLDLTSPTSGTLSPGSEMDVYQFEGSGGDRLYLDSLIPSSPGSWLLYGPGNQLVGSSELLKNDLERVLPADGTYYLVLRGDGTASTSINYQIQPFFSKADPTSLTLGDVVENVEISKLGEQDVYTFFGNVGEKLYFDPRSGSGSITANIQSPSGIAILPSGSMAGDSGPIVLTETGTYRLTVDGVNDTQASYSFRLADATEALFLPPATPTAGSLAPGETVLYQVSAVAGQKLQFDSISATPGAEWVLYAPSTSPGGRNTLELARTGLGNDFEAIAPTTGNYTLALALRNTWNNSVDYNIQALNAPISQIQNSGFGTVSSGSVTPQTPFISPTFTASAGTLVYFDSRMVPNGGNPVTVSFLDPGSNKVLTINGSLDSNASYGFAPVLLPATGKYTLLVEGNGSYNHSLLDLGASQALNLNALTNIPSIPAWGTAAYKFEGTVGQKLYYDALNNNPNVQARLISPSGRQFPNSTSTDKLETLTESGTYYLLLSNNQATPTAQVNFRLLNGADATDLNFDRDIESSFAPNPFQTDLYRFGGKTGQHVYFDALGGGGSNTWTLYGPGGQTIDAQAIFNDLREIPLPGDGEYLLALQGQNGSPATYKFRAHAPEFGLSSLSIGDTASGSISKAGEQDTYNINLVAGQRLYFDGITDSGSKNVRLVSPSGLDVFPNISTSSNRDLFVVQETGTYRAIVDANTTVTGTYSFRFLDAADASLVFPDTPFQTQAIDANTTKLMQFTGTAGQYIYFSNNYTGSSWKLFAPGNQTIIDNTTGDAELALPADGTYTLAFQGPSTGSTNYQFQMITPEFTTTEMMVGKKVEGTISKFGERDTYTFTGEIGQQVIFDSLTGKYDLGVKIYSPSGKEVYNRRTTEEQGPFTLLEAGTYRVEIDGNNRETGNYSFRLLDLASTNHPSVSNLRFDTNIVGNLSKAQEQQVYRFEGTEGQDLYFDKNGDWNWGNGTGWVLYGPGNQQLGASSSYWAVSDFEVKLPSSGTYTLVVGGNANVAATEAYQFQVVTPINVTSPLTLGQYVPARIDKPGEQDIYTFSGESGQRLFFDRTAGDSNFTAKLYSPSGTEVFSGTTSTDSDTPFFLRETGDYRLVIDGYNNRTGDYGFRLADVEAETELKLDTDIAATLNPGREVDFYYFQPPVGQPLYFDWLAGSGADWVLYGPDNKAIPTASGNGTDFEVTPSIPGTYVLAVRGNSATPVSYNFKVVTPKTTVTDLELGRSVTGTLSEAGERDEYAFVGTVGQRLFFDGFLGNNSISAKLFSPSGVEVTNNVPNKTVGNDWPPLTLTEAGNYRLVIDGDNNSTGDYGFRLDDVAQANHLEIGTLTPGSLETGRSAEIYQFTGTAGQKLNFDLTAPAWNGADWVLYGSNNQQIASSGWWGSDLNVLLPSNGLYILAVRGSSSTPVNYSFTVTDSTPAFVPTTGLGSIQSGNIAAGQIVERTFTASAGTRIYFDSQDVDGDAVSVSLFDPYGTPVFGTNASSDSNFIQLQQTGTYTVRVQGWNPSGGDYRYRILELPSVTPDPRDNENSLQMGVTASKTLDPGSSTEVYSFTGTVGQTIFFDGLIPPGGAKPVGASLISPSGTAIFSTPASANGSAVNAGPYTLTESGTYNLLVGGGQNTPADFRFRVLDFADAPELELNKRVSDTLQPGAPTNLYKFTGTAGQRVFFDSISGSGANWVLYQPGHQGSQPRTVGTQNFIGTDFEAVLPVDGEYVLAVIGYSTTASAYSFQTLSEKSVPAVVTPGDGETSGALGEELGAYRVVLEATDGKGGVAQQDFQVRVVPEPGDNAPVINTQAVTTGYTIGRYVYDVNAEDADGDRLTYLLADAPSGMIIDSETGRITWATPEANTGANPHKVSVRVEDSRGGVDIQSFDLSISNVVPGTIKGTVYLDADGDGDRKVTNPGNMTPDSRVVVSDRFKDNYAAYDLGRPGGVPGILGAMTFKHNPNGTVDPNTLLLGGGAASPGGALYEVKVLRGENGHIIGFDNDDDPETPYTATYFADSPYSDAGLVYTPDNVLLANMWKPAGVLSIKPGGVPNETYPLGLGGLTFVPEGIPGEGQFKAISAYPGNGFYTVKYTRDGSFPDGTPRYKFELPPHLETVAGAGPGAFVYMPVTAPNFDSGEGLLMVEWSAGGIYAYDIDNEGNPKPETRTPFITNYGGAWGGTTDPVTGDLLFNAWEGYNNLMVVRGLGQPTDNEPGMENWLVYVDNNRDGIQQPNEPFTYTDATGKYSFTLNPGTYRIVSQLQPGWTQTSPVSPTYQDVTVTANDLKFGIDFAATNSKLAGPNIDPEITSIPPTTVKAGEKLVYRTTATDLNNDDLTFELVLKPKGMAIAPNGTISWRPSLDTVGIENVIVRVNDGRGGTDLQSFQVEVTPGNNPPIFTSQLAENVSPQVGATFQYQAVALDKDGDNITYSIVSNLSKPVTPLEATINKTTGVITWRPTTAQQGGAFNWVYTGEAEPWEILIKATDNQGGEAFQRLELIVNPPADNQPPAITSKPRTTTRLGDAYFYQIEAIDPEGNPLTYSVANPPVGMTIDKDKGVIAWTPTASQLGVYPIAVTVSDGKSSVTQSFSLVADNISLNRAPSITSEPEQITNLERLYEYDVKGNDPDNDRLLWSLDSAPSGMLIDPISGAIRWQSTASQVGENTVVVRAIDGNGGYAVQEFTVTVRGINTPPSIVSAPLTKASKNQLYTYAVVANDLENDPITFTLGKHPVGMTVDGEGKIQWTPQSSQIGQQVVEVIATDKQGATATQSFTVNTGNDVINQPPVISSSPVFTAAIDRAYRYQVVATDADGTIAKYELIEKPSGMTINEATGAISWDNPVVGNHQVVVGVVDNLGAGSAQGFTLIGRANSAPVIPNVSPQQEVTLGNTYRYDLKATDAQGDLLTFALVEYPNGMTIDEYGRISWTPKTTDAGSRPIQVVVTDSFGSISIVTYDLTVVADSIPPKVNISTNLSSTTVNKGDSVTFTVNAVDNVKVESLGLTVNGTPVILDAKGQATVKLNSLGNVEVVATAKDAAGHIETTTQTVKVIDPSDVTFPIVSIDLDDDVEISAPIKIKGTISDSNLDYYIVEVAPVGGGEFKEIYRNDNPVNVNNDVIATFDPTVLANDAYILRVKAVDDNNHASITERVVNVAGDLKLGNFRLSFTDLSIPVSGIPITVTRSYDSLNANSTDDFGYGWRLEFRDTDLRTSLKSDAQYEELGINSVPFKDGTKVFITLPGGKRETFTFNPTPDRLNSYLAAAGPGGSMYHPAFKSQDGSTSTLTVKDTRLTRNGNEYYGLNGEPFNPVNPAFGGVYVLTTKEGIVYEIDANSGDLLTATDTNGNKLTFSDAGIKSSSGKEVTFGRDASGRIVNVVDPAGEKIEYEYDGKGDLVAVTDREDNTTRFKYEDEDRKHFLTEVIDPLGRSGVRTEYDDSGRLKQMIDANGEAVELVYDPDNSVQKVKDVFGKETTYVYDLRGNVLTEIDPLGKRIDRTYDGDNNVLSETVITREVNSQGNSVEVKSTTEWTYDGSGNKLTEKDALGNVSRWSYNGRGQVLTETDALGNTTTNTYSPSGNLKSTKDAAGNVTKYDYDLRGLRLSTTDANNKVTRYEYDNFGNLIRQVDALGNETTYSYNSLGNRLSESRKVTTSFGVEDLTNQWTYDSEGRVKSATDAEDYVTRYEYDAKGNRTAVIDALQRKTEYIYNERGLLEEIIYPDKNPNNPTQNLKLINGYDLAGRLVTRIDESDRITRYEYDDLGRLTQTIYADETPNDDLDNPRTKVEYYKNGDVKAEVDERGNRTEYRYNAKGELIEIIYPDDTPNTLLDNPRTTYKYDAAGRRISETNARNYTTTFVYDELDRLKETQLHDKTKTTTTYDALGRQISSTDQNGKVTRYEYDAVGRLTDVIQNINQPGIGLTELRTKYAYDEAGRLTSIKDAENRVTQYEYDLVGRPLVTILPGEEWSETIYDAVGNVVGTTDFNGDAVSYNYNSGTPASSGSQNPVRYIYTPTGKIASIADSRGTTAYNYDVRNRLISRTDPAGPYTPNGATIEYGYDAAGNITSVTVPSGTTSYTYDERNRLETVTDPDNGVTAYFYDAVGNLSRTELPNDVVEIREYDDLNRLKGLEYRQQETVISKFDYGLDAAGNRRVVTELNGRQVEYEYDDLYRLTKETITDAVAGNRTVSYTYDKVGNRQTRNDSVEGITTYSYDDNDRLEREELRQDGVVVRFYEYGYDDNGNMVSRRLNGTEETKYVWDKENRLIGVEMPTGDTVGYSYDVDGIRVSQTVNGVTTDYLVDKNRDYAQVLEERVNDVLGASYVYGRDLISQELGNTDSFYLVDGLGSTRGLTDGSGGITDVYNYDAFGNLIGKTGSTVNSYLYAGEQYDSNLGNYYLRKRYYDEYRGRFTAQDPFEGWMNDPMSLHNYLYADGNPVNAIDPSGLETLTDLLGGISAQAILDAISLVVYSTVFAFKQGTPNAFLPSPPPFPLPRPSEPELLINKPPSGEFSPSPAPFPVPQPEKPEPLVRRVPLLGLQEYLDNYVFETTGSNSKKLRKEIEATGEVFNPGDEAHHIIPSTDLIARAARQTLKSYGIDINSEVNGVRLSQAQHRQSGLHTDDAILEVVGRIVMKDSKAEVEAELRAIKAEILAGTFP